MALAFNEQWRNGFVVNTDTNQVAVTTSTAGSSWQGGFVRDPDGRLVVVSQ